jgi:carboxypeptidase family protein
MMSRFETKTHAAAASFTTRLSKWNRFAMWCACLAIVALFTTSVAAQDNASLTGTVTDPSGAAVVNASITITNVATGQVRNTVSNSSGDFLFANVGAGQYTMTASAPGFQKFSRAGILIHVAQTLEENVAFKVGNTQETVNVEADALQVQSETNEVSSLITGQQVTQLSTNGRNVTGLAALGMGKSNNLPAYSGANALTSANGISFNGTRASHNIYLLDGGELNDRGCGGCFSSLPSIDALSEFQTLDSNYGPDYGIGSGGTIAMVIKSGTKNFHGSVWEFNRNEAYQANNYFLNQAGKARPKFRLNIPGGNFGGHIGNNTFFFVNEEWRRQIQGSTPTVATAIPAADFPTLGQPLTYVLPSATAKVPVVPATNDPARLALYAADGLTPGQAFPNNTIPANLIDQNAVREMNAGTFPKPNFGTNQYISSIPQTTNVREDVVRLDHNIGSKFQAMGHYLHDAVNQTIYPPLWGNSTYPTVGSAMKNPSWSSTLKLTQTYTPTLLNETSFLWSGNTINLDPITGPGGSFVQPSGWSQTTFFPAADNFGSRMPEVGIGAPYNIRWSSSYYPWKNSYFGYEPKDDVSWTRGKHSFKFGFSWLHAVKNQELQANTQGTANFGNGSFSGDSFVNFLLGDADSFTQLQYLAGKHWVNNNYGFYGNDNWRVNQRLTLNLGLRYDGLPHAFERYDQFANFVPSLYDRSQPYPLNKADGTLLPSALTSFNGQNFYLNGVREAGANGFPRGNVKNSYYTFEPRVGFAYNVGGDGKTVIRSGIGIFYERVQGNDVYNAALNPPFAYQPSATNVYFSNPNTSALTGLTTSQTFPSTMTVLGYDYRPPGTAMFSFGVQRQLAPSVVAQVQYVGTRGWDQNNDRAINTLPLTANDPAAPGNPYYDRQGVAGKIPDPNNPDPTKPKFLPAFNANLYRQFPGFAGIRIEENESNQAYNSFQTGLRMENRHGLTVLLAYTWSHEIDEVSGDLNNVSNPFNLRYDRGSGSLDRRHIFNASYVYTIPFFNKSDNKFLHQVLGGWEFSGVTVAQSGTPIAIRYTGADVLGLGGDVTNRENIVAPIGLPHTVNAWFTKSSFGDPLAPWAGGSNSGFGNSGKDAVVGPGLFNFNLSLFKNIILTSREEGPRLQLRFESFNTFNHTEFNGIDTGSADGNFGKVTSTYDPRVLQLGAKFSF